MSHQSAPSVLSAEERGHHLRILLLEDDPSDAKLIQTILRRSGFEVLWVERLSDVLDALPSAEIDEILLDLSVPDSQGLETLQKVVKQDPGKAIVVLTGHADEETALQALAEGAQDYLVKGAADAGTVVRAVRYAYERNKADVALRSSEARMRAILEGALDAVIGMESTGLVSGWNRRAEEIFGWSYEEAVGKSMAELIIPERLRERHQKGLARFLATGVGPILGRRIELTALCRNGSEIPIEMTVSVIGDSERVMFNAFIRDISDRISTQAQLRASEERFRALVENSSDGILLLNEQARIVYASPAITRILGYTIEEVIGMNVFALVHPDDLEHAKERFQAARLESEPPIATEFRARHQDGSWRQVEVLRGNRLEDPSVHAIILNYRDVTERWKARQKLDEISKRYQLILDSLAEGVLGIDPDGNVMFENSMAVRMLGWDANELMGHCGHAAYHHTRNDGTPYPLEDCPIEATRTDGMVRRRNDEVFWRRDGTAFPVEYVATPILDGEIGGVAVTFRDITKEKQMESQIEQSMRVSSLGQIAASVAHEFNNVLMSIQSFADILQRKPAAADMAIALPVQRILDAVKRGKRVTHDVLRFTAPAELRPETFDAVSWMGSFYDEVRSILPQREVSQQPGPPLIVQADKGQLFQVMINLVANARDATSAGDSIALGALRADSFQFLQERVDFPDRFAALFVRDSGQGIPYAVLERIFEPLFTTKKSGGTGLGLAVAHQIATSHGGSILVDSPHGKGTTFYVLLPLKNG